MDFAKLQPREQTKSRYQLAPGYGIHNNTLPHHEESKQSSQGYDLSNTDYQQEKMARRNNYEIQSENVNERLENKKRKHTSMAY